MELYNIRDLKVFVGQVIHTPFGLKGRLRNKYVELNCQTSKYFFLIYSGKTKYLEIGFNNIGVYKVLRIIFNETSVNRIIMRVLEYAKAINK